MVLAMAYQMFKLKSTNLVQIVVTETGDSFLMYFTDALIGFEIFNWSNCQVLSNVILLDVITEKQFLSQIWLQCDQVMK